MLLELEGRESPVSLVNPLLGTGLAGLDALGNSGTPAAASYAPAPMSGNPTLFAAAPTPGAVALPVPTPVAGDAAPSMSGAAGAAAPADAYFASLGTEAAPALVADPMAGFAPAPAAPSPMPMMPGVPSPAAAATDGGAPSGPTLTISTTPAPATGTGNGSQAPMPNALTSSLAGQAGSGGYSSGSDSTGYSLGGMATGYSSGGGSSGYSSSGSDSTGYSSGGMTTGYSSGGYSTGGDSTGYSSGGASTGYSSGGTSSGSDSTGYSSGDMTTGSSTGGDSTGTSSGSDSMGYSSGGSSTGYSSGGMSTGYSSGGDSTGSSSGGSTTGFSSGGSTTGSGSGSGTGGGSNSTPSGSLITTFSWTPVESAPQPLQSSADQTNAGAGTPGQAQPLTGDFRQGALVGQTSSLVVAEFTESDPTLPADALAATVDPGDGTGVVAGRLQSLGDGEWEVVLDHAYAARGEYAAAVTLTDATGVQQATSTVEAGELQVGEAVLMRMTAQTTDGSPITNWVPVSPNGFIPDAAIDFGDGNFTAPGSLSYAGGALTVTTTHTYAIDSIDQPGGVYRPNLLLLSLAAGGQCVTVGGSVEVTRPPATGQMAALVEGADGTVAAQQLATFRVPEGVDPAAEFQAAVRWGDGSTSVGTVTGVGMMMAGSGGVFQVTGGHAYATAGAYHVEVDVTQAWGDRKKSLVLAGGAGAALPIVKPVVKAAPVTLKEFFDAYKTHLPIRVYQINVEMVKNVFGIDWNSAADRAMYGNVTGMVKTKERAANDYSYSFFSPVQFSTTADPAKDDIVQTATGEVVTNGIAAPGGAAIGPGLAEAWAILGDGTTNFPDLHLTKDAGLVSTAWPQVATDTLIVGAGVSTEGRAGAGDANTPLYRLWLGNPKNVNWDGQPNDPYKIVFSYDGMDK